MLQTVKPSTKMGLIIEEIIDFPYRTYAIAGDELRLSWRSRTGHDKPVMCRTLDDIEIITKAACIKIDCSVGFIMGGDDLEEVLLEKGFEWA